MTHTQHLAMAWLLTGLAAPALAADPPQQGGWFMPPPSTRAAGSTMDTSLKDTVETVTVIAKRATRSWRSKVGEDTLNSPLSSNSAHPVTPPQPYCNSTLRTVGGQPSDTAEMMSGIGSGGC